MFNISHVNQAGLGLVEPCEPLRCVVIKILDFVLTGNQNRSRKCSRAFRILDWSRSGCYVADDVATTATRRVVGFTAMNQMAVMERHLSGLKHDESPVRRKKTTIDPQS